MKGWQTAPLNALKSRMLWLHWLVKLPRGLAEVLGSFEGWQTALLNTFKKWGCRGPTGSSKGAAFCEFWDCARVANGTVERLEEQNAVAVTGS